MTADAKPRPLWRRMRYSRSTEPGYGYGREDERGWWSYAVVLGQVAVVGTVLVVVVGGAIFLAFTLWPQDMDVNTDPQVGWVDIGGGVSKRCDGTTMVYDGYKALDVVPNHEECS
jgi:hypothetical protein